MAVCCIWCLSSTGAPSDEHFWPAALGGGREAILPRGTVCQSCNNALGVLDQRLADEFDLFLLQAGVPRRGGKPPIVQNRGNLIAWMGPDGPCFEANLGPGPVESGGRRIPPPGNSPRHLRPTLLSLGPVPRVTLSQKLALDRRFVRALYKICLGAVCKVYGADQAREGKYNSIRQFVRNNNGDRRALLVVDPDQPSGFSFDGFFSHDLFGDIAAIRLGPARFVLALSDTDASLVELERTIRNPRILTRILPE